MVGTFNTLATKSGFKAEESKLAINDPPSKSMSKSNAATEF